jgi:hypothetical protein
MNQHATKRRIMPQPKRWPPRLTYLTAPLHSKALTKAQLSSIGTWHDGTEQISAEAVQLPSPLVNITPITDPCHPANGQCGLFATERLQPGSFILLYLGSVQPGAAEPPDHHSDYELWLDKDSAVAVDANKCGNEARFINDYRGVTDRPNAEFREVWSVRHRERCMAVFVLPEGKTKKTKAKTKVRAGIAKGEEILVSYGKGFWAYRNDNTAASTVAAAMPEDEDESTRDRGLATPTTK